MEVFRKFVAMRHNKKPPSTKLGQSELSLENFNMIRTLGTGSFGRVFLAKRKGAADSRVVAIKRLKKQHIIKQKQVDHVLSERAILIAVEHPFIVSMLGTFKDDRYLYIVMEYVNGGEFFTHLRKRKSFENKEVRFYAAQVTLMFEYLHSRHTIYRDLKPENLLVDDVGYLKLTDFGFAKIVPHRTYTLCGTPEYIAPEVLLQKGHGKPADWWTMGVLIYEMAAGYPPFFDDEPMGIYHKILTGKFTFPSNFDPACKSLVKSLLTADLTKRLGDLVGGPEDIKNHEWFKDFQWSKLLAKTLEAPFVPAVSGQDDSNNFDSYPESTERSPAITGDQDPFDKW